MRTGSQLDALEQVADLAQRPAHAHGARRRLRPPRARGTTSASAAAGRGRSREGTSGRGFELDAGLDLAEQIAPAMQCNGQERIE